MVSKREQDEFFRALGRLAVQETKVRVILDHEEAKELGCGVGEQIREYVPKRFEITL